MVIIDPFIQLVRATVSKASAFLHDPAQQPVLCLNAPERRVVGGMTERDHLINRDELIGIPPAQLLLDLFTLEEGRVVFANPAASKMLGCGFMKPCCDDDTATSIRSSSSKCS